jgi:hypothetical protein
MVSDFQKRKRMDEKQLSLLVDMENPQSVLNEVRKIFSMMFQQFDFDILSHIFEDIVCLFRGEYPGYRTCNTDYHDLKHTTDTFLAMARLVHGAFISGETFTTKQMMLGLICALMHDTGYIQTRDDEIGTGAKYTKIDTKRSIVFMNKYIADRGFSKEYFKHYPRILICADMDADIKKIRFDSRETELMCKMLGTADLLGQMADRTYLEKLLFLYYEFKEGGVMAYTNELDLLKKTASFYDMIKNRLTHMLGGMNTYMHYHFKARWGVDEDLYMETINSHIQYLTCILENHEKDYRAHLRRGGIIKKLEQTKNKPDLVGEG